MLTPHVTKIVSVEITMYGCALPSSQAFHHVGGVSTYLPMLVHHPVGQAPPPCSRITTCGFPVLWYANQPNGIVNQPCSFAPHVYLTYQGPDPGVTKQKFCYHVWYQPCNIPHCESAVGPVWWCGVGVVLVLPCTAWLVVHPPC